MRFLFLALAVFVAVSICPVAWSQNDDPFGGGNDPFGGGGAAQPPGHTAEARAVQVNALHRQAIERAKKAMTSGRQPIHVATANQYETEKRIHSAMNNKTSIAFANTPLNEALQMLSEMHDIPILADGRALEEIGLSTETPVTLNLKNVSLRTLFRLMLRELDLTYLIKDEVLQITTVEAAECNLILEMYALPDNLTTKSDKVIEAMQTTVVPDTWATLGGPSTAVAIDHVLVVSTTSDVHDQISEFLAKLIEKYGK